MKEQYLDIIEIAVGAYTLSHIRSYTEDVRSNGLSEHGFPRLTANIGFLIAHGRRTDLYDDFLSMMELCCDEINNPERYKAGNEFSVKEVVFAILELEKTGKVDKETTNRWRSKLSEIEPLKNYLVIASVPPKRIGNWAAFAATSEQVRKYSGIGSGSEKDNFFIDNQIASQMLSFDENGMYRDPHEPMVYDYITRLQLVTALFCGYRGEHYRELADMAERSADPTLYMQSVTGEIPFGGRSAQFLHNETSWAALCEYYAVLYKEKGDMKKAGMFKSAARMALDAFYRWADKNDMHHVKNYFPLETKYGCEDYAYFDKYMVTAGSWGCLAYLFADDSIPEVECPSVSGGYIYEPSEYFHKTFLCVGGYFVEYEKNADPDYDASGIGRIHKAGAPSAICLSVPMTDTPNFAIDVKNPSQMSLCFGKEINGEYVYSYNKIYECIEKEKTHDSISTVMRCTLSDGETATEKCTVSKNGVFLTLSGNGRLSYLVPVFDFDGKTHTEIEKSPDGTTVTVKYKGSTCKFKSSEKLSDTGKIFANRNGHYKLFEARGKRQESIELTVTIE